MNVAQLIEELQKLDQLAEVFVGTTELYRHEEHLFRNYPLNDLMVIRRQLTMRIKTEVVLLNSPAMEENDD